MAESMVAVSYTHLDVYKRQAVHKAQVSWKRIKPLMKHENYENADNSVKCDTLEVKGCLLYTSRCV